MRQTSGVAEDGQAAVNGPYTDEDGRAVAGRAGGGGGVLPSEPTAAHRAVKSIIGSDAATRTVTLSPRGSAREGGEQRGFAIAAPAKTGINAQ